MMGRFANKYRRVSLYARTVRHLRPVQVFARIGMRLYRPRPDRRPPPATQTLSGIWVEPARRRPSMVAPDMFCFLNRTASLTSARDWNHAVGDKLWLYNLHYFDDLNAEDAEARVQWHRDLIERWTAENPPAEGVGWDPYPTALRIVNWVKWSLRGNELPPQAEASLACQARWLRWRLEYHLLGNHLFANAKALVFAGYFFAGTEPQGWLQRGRSLLERELSEQVLPDGGHFERSPMYQLIVLEDVLDLINAARAYGHEVPDPWLDAARRMLGWAQVMRHPDGEIPFFNDAAIGIAPPPVEVDAYGRRLGVDADSTLRHATLLRESGYIRMNWGDGHVFMDVAPVGPDYLPGHAHADSLSFELSVGGQRLFVNSGTSTYEPGPLRQWQRGTAAHNTVVVDGADSSEVWGGFRVARRAYPRDVEADQSLGTVSAWHDGYCRFRGRPKHYRQLTLGEQGMDVHDLVSGRGSHSIEGRLHLHPDVEVVDLAHDPSGGKVSLLMSDIEGNASQVAVRVSGPATVNVEPAKYHPEFGRSVANQCIVYRYSGSLPMRVSVQVAW